MKKAMTFFWIVCLAMLCQASDNYVRVTSIAFPKLGEIPHSFLYYAFGVEPYWEESPYELPKVPVQTLDFRSVTNIENVSGLYFGCCTNLTTVRFDALASDFTGWEDIRDPYVWPNAMSTVKRVYMQNTDVPNNGTGFFFIGDNHAGITAVDKLGWDCACFIKNGTFGQWQAKQDGDTFPWQKHKWNFVEIQDDGYRDVYYLVVKPPTREDYTISGGRLTSLTLTCLASRTGGSYPLHRFYLEDVSSGIRTEGWSSSLGNNYYRISFSAGPYVTGRTYRFVAVFWDVERKTSATIRFDEE